MTGPNTAAELRSTTAVSAAADGTRVSQTACVCSEATIEARVTRGKVERRSSRQSQSPSRAECGIRVAPQLVILKLLGSYALAKLLGFGLVGGLVIYALLSLLT
jgi:hypothetical protein